MSWLSGDLLCMSFVCLRLIFPMIVIGTCPGSYCFASLYCYSLCSTIYAGVDTTGYTSLEGNVDGLLMVLKV